MVMATARLPILHSFLITYEGSVAALPNTALSWVRMCGMMILRLTRVEPLCRGLLRPTPPAGPPPPPGLGRMNRPLASLVRCPLRSEGLLSLCTL